MFFAQTTNGVKFSYRARNKEGKIEIGTINAFSKDEAALVLQKYNVFVVSIEEHKEREFFFKTIEFSKKVSKKELGVFFRQLSLMLESRVPLVQSLTSLSIQAHKPSFKEAIMKISNLVEEGLSLSESFDRFPLIFEKFYVDLIKSGEASGKISEALYYVSDHLEKESEIVSQIRQAMIYPVFVATVLFVVVIIITKLFMPKIASIIEETGVEPTFLTALILSFYKFLEVYWWFIIAVILMSIIFLFYYFNTKEGHIKFNRISLKIPFVKEFLKKIFLVRFCSNVSTLLVAGISINRALKITEGTVNNIVYKNITSEIEQKVSEGEKISFAMARYPEYFPPFIIQMIKVGEETGKLDKVLIEVVDFYQKEIKRSINLFSALLEPIIIIILGIAITILSLSVISSLYGAIGTI